MSSLRDYTPLFSIGLTDSRMKKVKKEKRLKNIFYL